MLLQRCSQLTNLSIRGVNRFEIVYFTFGNIDTEREHWLKESRGNFNTQRLVIASCTLESTIMSLTYTSTIEQYYTQI